MAGCQQRRVPGRHEMARLQGRDGIGGGVSKGESRGVVAMNKRDVTHVILLSRPARLPVDGGHGAAFEFLVRVGDRDEPFFDWMFELLVTAFDADSNPAVFFPIG